MTETENQQLPETESPSAPLLAVKEQIHLRKKGDIVYVTLPSIRVIEGSAWTILMADLKGRLPKIDQSWLAQTKAHLEAQDRLLDSRQIKELEQILSQINLKLDLIITTRRQTAVAGASAGYSVQQDANISLFATAETSQDLAEPLYLKNTLRSGTEIIHPSSVIVRGDVNPGASIIAGGDVYVWGSLKGIAHAGANGDRRALIMALRLIPTQIRIAELVARAPDTPPEDNMAEVAYIGLQGIRIRGAVYFNKIHTFDSQQQCWIS